MFEYWNKVLVLLGDQVDGSVLAPQKKSNVIPYLLEVVDSKIIVQIISNIENIEIFDSNEFDFIFENKYVIKDNTCYFVNLFEDGIMQRAYEKSNISRIGFNRTGIIDINHKFFKTTKTLKKITEHSSIKFFNNLIKTAIRTGATDIHISPRNTDSVYFRYRIDGFLQKDLIEDIDANSYSHLANQIIRKAGGNPGSFVNILTEKFVIKNDEMNATFRVSMMPTEFFFSNKSSIPRFVLRVHNNNAKIKDISDLSLSEYNYKKILNVVNLNQGLVVVTGGTGSGKTTLLYAILKAINSLQQGVSIQTAEDPVETILPMIDQCSINNAAGTTYQEVLKAFLRQDPDVGLIGEVRDEDTAQKTISMAATGHLALTTLHTNTGLGAINRLRRLGVDERDIADVLKVCISTRLIRKVCATCSIEELLEDKNYLKILKNPTESITIKAKGGGCKKCGWSGYSGRLLVTEVLFIDKHAQTMIVDKKSLAEIEDYLIKKDNQTIWHNALEILVNQETTLLELERVLPPFTT